LNIVYRSAINNSSDWKTSRTTRPLSRNPNVSLSNKTQFRQGAGQGFFLLGGRKSPKIAILVVV
jgi:hypothetical protein